MPRQSRSLCAVALAAASLWCCSCAWAIGSFDIVITPGATLGANAAALAAMNRAAARWKAGIADPIRINIGADFGTIASASTLADSSLILYDLDFDTVRSAMIAHKPASVLMAALPTASQFTANHPADTSLLPGMLEITRANRKALGLQSSDTNSDGSIKFNSAVNFDFDSSNGVSAGSNDFESVAAHEIGHILGFISDVDDFDGPATVSLPTTLDLFRFPTALPPSTLSQFTAFSREMRPAVASITDDLNNQWSMSTGVLLGDGFQASHWKSATLTGTTIGLMEPALTVGTSQPLTMADWQAMSLIGYNAVPEPATLGILATAMLLVTRPRITGRSSSTPTT